MYRLSMKLKELQVDIKPDEKTDEEKVEAPIKRGRGRPKKVN